MKVLVGYATGEGQSRKVARFVSERLVDAGQSVELLDLCDAEGLDLDRFDRAILVSSIHAGHYKAGLVDFVTENGDCLMKRPVLFLSVSLVAAGHDAEDWRALDAIVADLTEATGWAPTAVEHVAGAYLPSEYDIFTGFIMRRIIAEKDPGTDLREDREYTDWAALGLTIDSWIAG